MGGKEAPKSPMKGVGPATYAVRLRRLWNGEKNARTYILLMNWITSVLPLCNCRAQSAPLLSICLPRSNSIHWLSVLYFLGGKEKCVRTADATFVVNEVLSHSHPALACPFEKQTVVLLAVCDSIA